MVHKILLLYLTDNKITLNIKRCLVKRSCVFPNCYEQPLFQVPKQKRIELASKKELIVPKQTKICQTHLLNDCWSVVKDTGIFLYTPDMLNEALLLLKLAANHEKPVQRDIGLSDQQFQELSACLINFNERYPSFGEAALQVYLRRLRTGCTINELATEYSVSVGTIQNRIRIARQALLEEFVPTLLGKKSDSTYITKIA